MDDIVIRAMAKWPNVPSVYGWLALDRRGQWRIKGADGNFERVANPAVLKFIERNYVRGEEGRWYFQNGPQRVYVTLEYTPLVYRVSTTSAQGFESHCGVPATTLRGAWMDEEGDLLLLTELGPGLIVDRDLPRALEGLTGPGGQALPEQRLLALLETPQDAAGAYFRVGDVSLPLQRMRSTEAPTRFGYVRVPLPPAGQAEC